MTNWNDPAYLDKTDHMHRLIRLRGFTDSHIYHLKKREFYARIGCPHCKRELEQQAQREYESIFGKDMN